MARFQLFDDLNGVAADLAPPSGLGQHQGLLGCTFQLHSITLYQISLTFCAEPFFFTAGKPRLQTLQKQPGGETNFPTPSLRRGDGGPTRFDIGLRESLLKPQARGPGTATPTTWVRRCKCHL